MGIYGMPDQEQIARDIAAVYIEHASENGEVANRHNWVVDEIEKRVSINDILDEREYEELLDSIEMDVEDAIAECYCTQLEISFDLFALKNIEQFAI